MEGISHEVCSLAGTLRLGKLIVFYDDNGISIDGDVKGWFTDETAQRFRAYHWHVIEPVDGHDWRAVKAAIDEAREARDRPSLICCQTIIGWGAPGKQGTESAHGAPLGGDEVARARDTLGWPHPPFVVPEELYAALGCARARGSVSKSNGARGSPLIAPSTRPSRRSSSVGCGASCRRTGSRMHERSSIGWPQGPRTSPRARHRRTH